MGEKVFYEEFDSFYYYSGSTQSWEMQGYHFHKNYEILLFMCDGASIFIDGRSYTAKTGDLFLINNKEYHKTTGVAGEGYDRYVVMFDPDPVRAAGEAMGYPFTEYFDSRPESFIHRLRLSGSHLDTAVSLLLKIEKCSRRRGSREDRIKLLLALMELLTHINQMYGFFAEKEGEAGGEALKGEADILQDRERIEQMKKYIAAHVEDKLDLDSLSRRFYMNRNYLSHYFKKETGFTISQYITNHKIAEAKELLKKGFTVTETAVALSYGSDSHFIHTFKKMTGTTPKKYASEE